jgi:hypothetical protein
LRRALLVILGLIIFIGVLSAWVMVPVAGHLRRAQEAIAETGADLRAADLVDAKDELKAASDRLNSPAGKALRLVPLVGSNVGSVKTVTEALIPVVDTASTLERSSRALRRGGFIEDGRFRIADLRDLQEPLDEEVAALRGLEIAARDSMTGVTLPPLWDELAEIAQRAAELRRGLADATTLVSRAPDILGAREPRRYLVMLINNAELRGAGGILAGVGTMAFDGGKLKLEGMYSVHDLDVEPRIEVPAPPTYERRFSQFDANTTLWLNSTYSPDVPDVALVASRLFQRVTGIKTHGAIMLDPRGLSALLEEDAVLELENLGDVPAPDLPRVVYSDAYEVFTDQIGRREAILQLGVAAFQSFLDEGLPDDGPEKIGEAVAGGHLGFVSFDPTENQALSGVGASHDLPPVPGDVLLVTTQNFGYSDEGTKLDYWVKRRTDHSCEIEPEVATCATSVRFRNDTPKGLSTYVAGKPYGRLRTYVEVYVPDDAELQEVRVDGREVDFRPDPHDDMLSLGIYLEIERNETSEVTAVYRLPLGPDGYRLVATPQPLTRDARVSIALGVPEGWAASGPGEVDDGSLRLVESFDSPLEIQIAPEERKGLSAVWRKLSRFWSEPLF